MAKLDSLAPELAYLVQSLNAQARSLNRYAAEVEQIQDEQRALERERTDAQATLDGYHRRFRELAVSFPNEELLPDPPGRAERAHLEEAMSDEKRVLQSIDIRWDELVSRRRAADSACGQQFGSVEVLGVLNAFTPTRITGLPADELLARLATLSAIDLAVLLAQYPLLTTQALQADPVRTAAWWRSLSGPDGAVPSPAQLALITGAPALIGALEGVAYWARDQANRSLLNARATELTNLKRTVAGMLADGHAPAAGRLLAEKGYSFVTFGEAVSSVTAIRETLERAESGAPRMLLSLDLGEHPTASISIGDLDTAERITYLIPGMGTTVAGQMNFWTTAAENLYDEQQKLATMHGQTAQLATVAWIGYQAPVVGLNEDGVLEVANGDLARVGGHRLAAALGGTSAVHGWSPEDARLALVAHSFGSTVATNALVEASAGSLTMIGSAGVERSIPNAAALNVPAGQVFASQGAQDQWAGPGQLASGRADPLGGTFGARQFSSETTIDPGSREILHGVTDHSTQQSAEHPGGYGYLDVRTESLHNIALLTTGRDADVPVYFPTVARNNEGYIGLE
ncbi:alpha/beta hydrolase [Cryobacterium zhongshanensis]|uniref:Alpha/beta hydrolase family protein n=1 Tax=Cryobacterium zhongshanensis TaxID=2928153 RepID=A0AA41UFA1_9MICO|nr:alpha/beta hydrolase [Cryobacterium zhongshanensis]MCI4657785.1 alpha/beta hydrolase family protein [Cryobacterium zhongshanensis]